MTSNRFVPTALALALAALALAGCTTAATAGLAIDFAGTQPNAQATLAVDAQAAASQRYYATAGLEHPGAYTAFDQIVQWSDATGTPITVEAFSWGFCLGRIDGVPEVSGCQPRSTAYWSLAVNGTESSVGMADVVLVGGERVTWTLVPLPPDDALQASDTPAPLSIAAAAPPPTREASVTLEGEVSRAARLSFTLRHGEESIALPGFDAEGPWSATVDLPFGNSTLEVAADDGTATMRTSLSLVRLAKGTMQVDFKGVPGHAARDDEVWFDPDSFPSASYYEGQAVPHPAHANAHDLMAAWTAQTGIPVVYKPHDSFGQQVMQIDGVGDPTNTSSLAWCYEVNGATAAFGITDQPFAHGDVVSWSLGTC